MSRGPNGLRVYRLPLPCAEALVDGGGGLLETSDEVVGLERLPFPSRKTWLDDSAVGRRLLESRSEKW